MSSEGMSQMIFSGYGQINVKINPIEFIVNQMSRSGNICYQIALQYMTSDNFRNNSPVSIKFWLDLF